MSRIVRVVVSALAAAIVVGGTSLALAQKLPPAPSVLPPPPVLVKPIAPGATRVIVQAHRTHLTGAHVRMQGDVTELILTGATTSPPHITANFAVVGPRSSQSAYIRIVGRGATGAALRQCHQAATSLVVSPNQNVQFEMVIEPPSPIGDRLDTSSVTINIPEGSAITCGIGPNTTVAFIR